MGYQKGPSIWQYSDPKIVMGALFGYMERTGLNIGQLSRITGIPHQRLNKYYRPGRLGSMPRKKWLGRIRDFLEYAGTLDPDEAAESEPRPFEYAGLRRARELARIPIERAARNTGVSVQTWIRYEAGATSPGEKKGKRIYTYIARMMDRKRTKARLSDEERFIFQDELFAKKAPPSREIPVSMLPQEERRMFYQFCHGQRGTKPWPSESPEDFLGYRELQDAVNRLLQETRNARMMPGPGESGFAGETVLEKKYFGGMTLEEIGSEFNMTREGARRRKTAELIKLRKYLDRNPRMREKLRQMWQESSDR